VPQDDEKVYKITTRTDRGRLIHVVEGPGVHREFADSSSLKKAIELSSHCESSYVEGMRFVYERLKSTGIIVPSSHSEQGGPS